MKRTKKELEEREIKLEAIIDAYKQVIDQFYSSMPFVATLQLQDFSNGLHKAAEVRDNIGDFVEFEINYEGDDD